MTLRENCACGRSCLAIAYQGMKDAFYFKCNCGNNWFVTTMKKERHVISTKNPDYYRIKPLSPMQKSVLTKILDKEILYEHRGVVFIGKERTNRKMVVSLVNCLAIYPKVDEDGIYYNITRQGRMILEDGWILKHKDLVK